MTEPYMDRQRIARFAKHLRDLKISRADFRAIRHHEGHTKPGNDWTREDYRQALLIAKRAAITRDAFMKGGAHRTTGRGLTVREQITFWVPGKPVGYTRNLARWAAMPREVAAWRQAVAGAYLAEVTRAPTPNGHDKTRPVLAPAPYPWLVSLTVVFTGSRADVDNLVKEVMDALNGHAWTDDRQVSELHAYIADRMRPNGKRKRGESRPDPGAMITIRHL